MKALKKLSMIERICPSGTIVSHVRNTESGEKASAASFIRLSIRASTPCCIGRRSGRPRKARASSGVQSI
jgi:hypothetical protein